MKRRSRRSSRKSSRRSRSRSPDRARNGKKMTLWMKAVQNVGGLSDISKVRREHEYLINEKNKSKRKSKRL
jgi:hypothetical protein